MSAPYELANIHNTIEEVCRSIGSRKNLLSIWDSLGEDRLWQELVACILGSRVSYETANMALTRLIDSGLLEKKKRATCFSRYEADLELVLSNLRYPFPNQRAKHIRRSAEIIYGKNRTIHRLLRKNSNVNGARKRLVEEISGIGPKQASLFLRNIGYSNELAVLDIHVLTYMFWVGLIPKEFAYMRNIKQYEGIEKIFLAHAYKMGFSADRFDLAIWVVMRVVKKEYKHWQ